MPYGKKKMNKVKRFKLKENMRGDERGWVLNPLEVAGSNHEFGNIHTASITPSSMRGNHYHTNSTEWLFVFGGPAIFYWRTLKENSIHEEIICEGEPALFEIQPQIAHVIRNTSKRDIYIVAFTDSNNPNQVHYSFITNP